ncbi:MAG TPA: hypothetical protein VGB42_04885 [Candidatus Thermoplasmatota archaeon]
MDLPGWARHPYSFLRYLVPGFYLLALGGAFFPGPLSGAMFDNWVMQRHEGVAIIFLLSWALMLGVMMHLAYRVLRATVLGPPEAAPEALRGALLRAGVPADRLTRDQLRAVFEATAAERGLASRAAPAGEPVALELGYTACLALASAGGFLAAGQGGGALVSDNWHEAQGAAFLAAAVFFAASLRWRERQIALVELAAFPVEDPELVAAAARACQRIWGPPPAG